MESILIVDDDINLCTVLQEELSEVGYSVDYVNNGFDVLGFLNNKPVDLLLLDLKMPGKTDLKYLVT
jgi:CheY-like chemotaxis protein